ncbi:ribosome biogenesis factor YjgA [Kushneria aurantia]|uniref:Dual-action ribosomal maturation protein DarP n=1 Tax=Kushneria aurantia TaxID=504092 RepID=A0ABV6G3R2_9GAMM|nr:ribosome biogenesis factor YjgA [Kushneria aurantia]
MARKSSRRLQQEEERRLLDEQRDESLYHDNGRPNKTRLKHQAEALRELGEAIIALPEAQRARLPLSDDMLTAIDESHRITAREAQRRHLHYVGKVMRHEDVDAIRAEMEAMAREKRQRELRFHQFEQWRDRLIEGEGDVITEFVALYPNVDRQALGQLVRNARAERDAGKPPVSARKLFRLIRDHAEA